MSVVHNSGSDQSSIKTFGFGVFLNFLLELLIMEISAINTLLLLILLNIDSVISGEPVICLVALSTVNSTEIGFNDLSLA